MLSKDLGKARTITGCLCQKKNKDLFRPAWKELTFELSSLFRSLTVVQKEQKCSLSDGSHHVGRVITQFQKDSDRSRL